jgi:hypothetical protein
VPISYFSLNDFLNLIQELRAFPEILAYLEQRALLPEPDRAGVGGEPVIYYQYLKNEGGFAGWTNFCEMQQAGLSRADEMLELFRTKHDLDRDSRFVEVVGDRLAMRLETYRHDLPPEVLERFDSPDNRANYLLMQEELCDLNLVERRALGKMHADLSAMLDDDSSPSSLTYAVWDDVKRGRLYIISASRGVSRRDAINAASQLLVGGLAFYGKERGIAIVARQGENFEVMLMAGIQPTKESLAVGKARFGSLRVSRFIGSIVSDLVKERG